jgi:hypothetical protein
MFARFLARFRNPRRPLAAGGRRYQVVESEAQFVEAGKQGQPVALLLRFDAYKSLLDGHRLYDLRLLCARCRTPTSQAFELRLIAAESGQVTSVGEWLSGSKVHGSAACPACRSHEALVVWN